jgi:hypothetical protein
MAGAIVVLSFALMLNFLKYRNGATPVPAASAKLVCPVQTQVELIEVHIAKAVEQGVTKSLEPVLHFQTEILRQIANSQAQAVQSIAQIAHAQTKIEAEVNTLLFSLQNARGQA